MLLAKQYLSWNNCVQKKKKIQTKPNNDKKKSTTFHDFNLKNSLALKKKISL